MFPFSVEMKRESTFKFLETSVKICTSLSWKYSHAISLFVIFSRALRWLHFYSLRCDWLNRFVSSRHWIETLSRTCCLCFSLSTYTAGIYLSFFSLGFVGSIACKNQDFGKSCQGSIESEGTFLKRQKGAIKHSSIIYFVIVACKSQFYIALRKCFTKPKSNVRNYSSSSISRHWRLGNSTVGSEKSNVVAC